MTADHDLEAILRRAMHASADPVEPAGDGLQIIQSRVARPRLQRQWGLLLSETVDLIFLIGIRLEPAATRARDMLRRMVAAMLHAIRPAGTGTGADAGRSRHGAAHRSRPPGRLTGRFGPAMAWLRPTLAVAGAVVIVVAGVATLFTLRQNVTGIGLLTGGAGNQPAASSPGVPHRHHTGVPGVSTTAPYVTGRIPAKGARHHAAPTPTCTSARPAAGSPSPTDSATPTGSPTVTPTPTGTISPSPTPSGAITPAVPTTAATPAALNASSATASLTSRCVSPRKSGTPTGKSSTASPAG